MTSTSDSPPTAGVDAADRLAALEARVSALGAAEAARTLLHDYALACDEHDVDGVMALFDADGDLWAGPRWFHGHDEIRAFYARAFDRPRRHIVGVPALVPVDATTLTAHASFAAVETGPGGAGLTWGSYTDRIVVTDGHARFASRRITIDGSTAP